MSTDVQLIAGQALVIITGQLPQRKLSSQSTPPENRTGDLLSRITHPEAPETKTTPHISENQIQNPKVGITYSETHSKPTPLWMEKRAK